MKRNIKLDKKTPLSQPRHSLYDPPKFIVCVIFRLSTRQQIFRTASKRPSDRQTASSWVECCISIQTVSLPVTLVFPYHPETLTTMPSLRVSKQRSISRSPAHYFNFDEMNCFDLNKCEKLKSAHQSQTTQIRGTNLSQMFEAYNDTRSHGLLLKQDLFPCCLESLQIQ